MKIGVPGEFHEDRWQRTGEESERRLIPRTREAGGSHRIEVIAGRRGVLWPVFGTATLPTSISVASPRGEGVIYRVFGTGTLPTSISVASSRGKEGFYRHFCTGTLNWSTSGAGSRGEGKEIGTLDGIMVGVTTGFGTAPPATGGSEASPRGEGDIYRHFGTGTPPTDASEPSPRGEGGFYRHFGTGTLNWSTSGAGSRAEGKGIGTVAGIKVGFTTGFGTVHQATGGSEAGPRGEGVIYRVFGTGTLPTSISVASSRGKAFFWPSFGTAHPATGGSEAGPRDEGDIYRHFGTATLPTSISVAFSRDEGDIYRHFGTGTLLTGTSVPSRRGGGVHPAHQKGHFVHQESHFVHQDGHFVSIFMQKAAYSGMASDLTYS